MALQMAQYCAWRHGYLSSGLCCRNRMVNDYRQDRQGQQCKHRVIVVCSCNQAQ